MESRDKETETQAALALGVNGEFFVWAKQSLLFFLDL
jgi:hypothetical protein